MTRSRLMCGGAIVVTMALLFIVGGQASHRYFQRVGFGPSESGDKDAAPFQNAQQRISGTVANRSISAPQTPSCESEASTQNSEAECPSREAAHASRTVTPSTSTMPPLTPSYRVRFQQVRPATALPGNADQQRAKGPKSSRREVPSGARLTLFSSNLGNEPGVVLLNLRGTSTGCKVVDWRDNSVTVDLPRLGLSGGTDAEICIVSVDGRIAKTFPVSFVPQPDILIHEDAVPLPMPAPPSPATYAIPVNGGLTLYPSDASAEGPLTNSTKPSEEPLPDKGSTEHNLPEPLPPRGSR